MYHATRQLREAASLASSLPSYINRSARPLKARQGCHTQTNHTHLGGPGCASVGPPPRGGGATGRSAAGAALSLGV